MKLIVQIKKLYLPTYNSNHLTEIRKLHHQEYLTEIIEQTQIKKRSKNQATTHQKKPKQQQQQQPVRQERRSLSKGDLYSYRRLNFK